MPSRRLILIWPRYIASLGQPILDLSWITPNIAISGSVPTRKHNQLMHAGIKAIVDLREEDVDDAVSLASHGIDFHHIPVKNYHAPSQEELQDGSTWVLSKLGNSQSDSKALIHCQEGVGRSVALTCCVLMKQGNTLQESLTIIRKRRWGIALRKAQMQALVNFENSLRLG
mgnify:CR=1 FL=1